MPMTEYKDVQRTESSSERLFHLFRHTFNIEMHYHSVASILALIGAVNGHGGGRHYVIDGISHHG